MKLTRIYISMMITALTLLFFYSNNLFSQEKVSPAKSYPNPLSYSSIAFQNNLEFNIPPNNGFKWALNFMPMINFKIAGKLNSINRIYLPVISQSNVFKMQNQTGIGDLLLSSFLSPKGNHFIWGVGPSMNFPTATHELLGSKKWAAGPSLIASYAKGKVVAGGLYLHIWSFAGDTGRADFSYSYFQPVLIYNMKKGWGINLTAEMGNEFKNDIFSGATILSVSKLVRISKIPINLTLGPKYHFGNINKPEFGIRAVINILLM
jgi:hypothetical protein